jgi:hypothetical protein
MARSVRHTPIHTACSIAPGEGRAVRRAFAKRERKAVKLALTQGQPAGFRFVEPIGYALGDGKGWMSNWDPDCYTKAMRK